MKKVWMSGLLLLALSIPRMGFAQPDGDLELGEVVVTATRHEEEIRKIPANVTVITEEDIKNSNAQTIPEVLKTEAGIVVRDFLGTGKTVTLDIRGFGETAPLNSLVLVDGRRINEIDLAGVDWAQISLDQVERIEIVRGAGSVLYGDNAVGGVINIITKKGRGKPSFELAGNYGSYDFNSERAAIGGSYKGFSYSVRGGYQETDGYRHNNEFCAKDVGGKFTYEPTKSILLGLSAGYHEDDYGLPGPLSEEQLKSDRKQADAPEDDASTESYYSVLSFEISTKRVGDFLADLSFRKRKTSEHYEGESLGSPYTFDSKSEIDTFGFTPRYTLKKYLGDMENKFILGFDLYFTDLDRDSEYVDPFFLSEDTIRFEKRSWGVYLNDELSILENIILTLGARYESAKYEFDSTKILFGSTTSSFQDSLEESEPAYNVGLSFLYGEKSSAFARYSRSFRYPVADEYFVFFPPPVTVNKELKVQTGDHYELGVKHYFTPDIQGGLTLFNFDLEDEIFYNPFTYANENYDKTRHQGVELSARAKLHEKVTLYGNYTYTRAKFRGGEFAGNHIPAVPQHKGSIGGLFTLNPNLNLSIALNYVGKSHFISDQKNEFSRLEDYTTVDTKISYTWKELTAYFGVNNLFDEEYSQYGVISGGQKFFYPAPEINFIGGLSHGF